jgi:hypothetical protein
MKNFRFEDPNHFVIGTIGLPGEREFFLQVGNGENVSSFALEVDNHRFQLITPLESEFQIGVITITWRPESERFHIEVEGIEDAGENGFARESQGLEIIVSPDLLTAFSSHTLEVVAAGRQPCIFCGNPVNSDGHLCPRSNGYRRMG